VGKYQLRQKVIRRINRFEITSDDIECLIYFGNLRFDQDPELDLGPREPYATIEMVISDFSDRKRYDLKAIETRARMQILGSPRSGLIL
jgi:hypothetical protein